MEFLMRLWRQSNICVRRFLYELMYLFCYFLLRLFLFCCCFILCTFYRILSHQTYEPHIIIQYSVVPILGKTLAIHSIDHAVSSWCPGFQNFFLQALTLNILYSQYTPFSVNPLFIFLPNKNRLIGKIVLFHIR